MKRGCLVLLMFLFIFVAGTSQAQFVVREFDSPGPDPRGLTWDGQYLWCADFNLDSLFRIDVITGQVVHTIPFVFDYTYGGGIAWDDTGAIWVTKRQYVYKLDPETGQEQSNFHCPGG